MKTYVILRRGGWRSGEDLQAAAARSTAEGERMPDDVRWIRSYVLDEPDGTVGTVCIYEASSPEAIRRHATAADLPVDEIAIPAKRSSNMPMRASAALTDDDRFLLIYNFTPAQSVMTCAHACAALLFVLRT